MKLPKELTTVTPLSKFVALVMFATLPIIFFLLGIRYEKEILRQELIPTIIQSAISPIPQKLQPPPYGKVSIQGTVVDYDARPAEVDGEPVLTVKITNNNLFKILLPSGESSCTLSPAVNGTISNLSVGNYVEVYGTAATNDKIIVCDADEYIKILGASNNF